MSGFLGALVPWGVVYGGGGFIVGLVVAMVLVIAIDPGRPAWTDDSDAIICVLDGSYHCPCSHHDDAAGCCWCGRRPRPPATWRDRSWRRT